MLLIESAGSRAAAASRVGLATEPDRELSRDRALTSWACGCSDDVVACNHERCADIVPELIIELI